MPRTFVTPSSKNQALSKSEQIALARGTRLKVQNILAEHHFSANSSITAISNTALSISNMLEEITHNISKMDQNLYSAKANMEELLRTNSSNNDFIALG